MILATSVLITSILCCQANCEQVIVLYGKQAPWSHKHAAQEFAKYAERLTGSNVAVTDHMKALLGCKNAVLIGNAQSNERIKRLQDKGLVSFSKVKAGSDGFIIRTVKDGESNYLILGGNNDRSALYAVYHYLDKFCKVGFFEDGERIPTIDKLPFHGISVVSNPRFAYRFRSKFGSGHVMLSKYTHHFWDWNDYKRNLDWWAKRKINMSSECLSVDVDTLVESIVRRVFGVGPAPAEVSRDSGWPSTWDWPGEYRTQILRKELDYGRKLGIEFDYYFPFGAVPLRFKQKHPEFKYTDGCCQIDPSDAHGKEYTKRLIREVIKELGTDHIYSCGVYGEAAPGSDPLQLKIDASLQLIDILRETDHSFKIWRTDAWAYAYNPGGIWTQENVKKYLSLMPRGTLYIVDNTCDMYNPPTYEQHGYYYGHLWAFGVINTLAGHDQWAGNFDDVLSKVKEVTSSPEGANCVGFHIMPENNATTPLFWQFASELAWNPEGVTVEGFLKDFVIRRYGDASAPNMVKCYRKVVEAMKYNCAYNYKHSPTRDPLYRFQYPYNTWGFPNLPENLDSEMAAAGNAAQLWRDGIHFALLEKDKQKDNKLYENDMVDMTRGYLSCLFDQHFIRFILAAKAGDKTTRDDAQQKSDACLEWIEKVLSTRDDFSLTKDIERIMSVPGTNPNTPRYIRERYIVHNYCVVDSVELMHHFNRPRVKSFMAGLKGEQYATDQEIGLRWIDGPIAVDEQYMFKGSTMEAVCRAFEATGWQIGWGK
jgi:hypothetical protein